MQQSYIQGDPRACPPGRPSLSGAALLVKYANRQTTSLRILVAHCSAIGLSVVATPPCRAIRFCKEISPRNR